MSIEIRPPTDDEWPDVCRFDGRSFGFTYTPEEMDAKREAHDMARFRMAVDDDAIVALAGSYALEVTLPGGASVPMGGVTWVSTAATHRRRGLMRRVVDAVHDDIDARGEPVASLFASEGGIYERLGYGISTHVRSTSIEVHTTRLRPELVSVAGEVRYVEAPDAAPRLAEIWERYRRRRAGETARSAQDMSFLMRLRDQPDDALSPALYLCHDDGYACYRLESHWNDGHPRHRLHVIELAAATPDAHLALWRTLLEIDLIGTITSNCIAPDDPLPYMLVNQRSLRTTQLNDGVWVNVRDVAMAFAARTYRVTDRIVVEADGRRWTIEGGPEGGSCRRARTKPDLVTTHAGLSSLLYGGTLPSALVAGRRMEARSDDATARGDLFFATGRPPHCQDHY